MADDWEWQISQLRERIDYLESEMERRDAWLINSIWKVVGNVQGIIRYGVILAVLFIMEWDETWQILLGLIVAGFWWWIESGRLARLEAEDKVNITRP